MREVEFRQSPRDAPRGDARAAGARGAVARLLPHLLAALWIALAPAAMAEDTKNVLVLYGNNAELPWIKIFDASLRSAVTGATTHRVEFYTEYFDIARFPSEKQAAAFMALVRARYSKRNIDVLVSGGTTAFEFLISRKKRLFPDVPLVYSFLPPDRREVSSLPAGVVGVPVDFSPLPTIELALRLQPGTKRLVLVTGAGPWDRAWEKRLREETARLSGRLPVEFLAGLPTARVLERLQALPRDTVVFTPGYFHDGAGTPFAPRDAVTAMAARSAAPVYVPYETQIDTGAVGGVIPTFDAVGRQTGAVVAALLEGQPPATLDLPRVLSGVPLIDWRQLRRWSMDEHLLPAGSSVRFKPESVWRRYRWYVASVLVVIAIQGATIAGLLLQRARRRRVEGALQESQQLMEMAASAGEFGMWGRDLSTGLVWANAPLRTLLGLCQDGELRFSDLVERIHPDDRVQMMVAVQDSQERGLPFEGECRTVLPDGTERWLLVKGRSVADRRRGRKTRRMGVVIDITERKRVEETLRESEMRFRMMANTAPVMIWMSGLDRLCTFFNRGWLDFTGRTLEQELGNGWAEGVHREDYDRCLKTYTRSFDARQEFSMEYRLRRFDGEYRWVLDHGVPRSDSNGGFLGYIGTAIDITELKRSEENFRLAVEAAPSAMVMVDQQGRIGMVNAQTERMFGYARGELIGQGVEVLVPEPHRVDHPRHRARFLAGPRARPMGAGQELFGQRKDGTRVPVEIGLNPVHAPEGLIVLASIIDISERKRAEKESVEQRSELAHLSRVFALGQLSVSIAHELNQPLAAILGNAEAARKMLGRERVDLAELQAICDDIVTEDRRAAEVIRRLRALYKRGEIKLEALDLNGLVRETLNLLETELLTRHVIAVVDLAASLPVINADRVQLQQVLLNMILNAADAVSVNAEQERVVTVRTEAAGADVQLSVVDRGPGIAMENLERVFDAFWTTKPGGMGMGLAICRSIVVAHHGSLTALNNAGGGATFRATLPVRAAA